MSNFALNFAEEELTSNQNQFHHVYPNTAPPPKLPFVDARKVHGTS